MTPIPELADLISAEECLATGRAIAAMQESTGAMPWFPGGQTDPWDHIESAMALSATGLIAEAEAAYEWSRRTQRADGSWAIRTVLGKDEDIARLGSGELTRQAVAGDLTAGLDTLDGDVLVGQPG